MAAGVDSLLRMLAQYGADELRLATDEPPRMLQRGAPLRLSIPSTNDDMLRHLVAPLLSDEREATLKSAGTVDLCYALDGGERFAVVFQQRAEAGFSVV